MKLVMNSMIRGKWAVEHGGALISLRAFLKPRYLYATFIWAPLWRMGWVTP